MILLQIGTVNDAEDVLLMGKIVFRNFHAGNLVELFRDAAIMGDFKLFPQGSGNHLFMLLAIFPEVGVTGAFRGAGICHIENIFEFGRITGVVNEGDSLCTAPNVATHTPVPQFVVCTGGGFRPLGINHELLMVGVFIEPGSGGQKIRPVLIASGYFLGGKVC